MESGAESPPSTSPAERVLEAVSEHLDLEIKDLPPLYGTIDPESLDEVIRALDWGVVRFEYADCRVTVRSDGSVDVDDEPADASGRAGSLADD